MGDIFDLARASASRMLGTFVLLLLCALSVFSRPAGAEPGHEPERAQIAVRLDIPAQALEDALYAFSAATKIAVFVDGSTVSGRRSTAVKGTFTAVEGLRILLIGTGLDAEPVGARAVTLLARPGPESSGSMAYRRYSAILQRAALRRLCGDEMTAPGTYRMAMQLWIDERGQVTRAELLSSTGHAARDGRVRGLMMQISGEPPPPMLRQPIVLLILPRPPEATGDCGTGGRARSR
jgi:hypothetical protein